MSKHPIHWLPAVGRCGGRWRVVALLISWWVPGAYRSATFADYPDLPRTVELGLGNEDAKAMLRRHIVPDPPDNELQMRIYLACHGKDILPREVLDLRQRDFRGARIHLELDAVYKVNFDDCDFTGASLEETWFVKCSLRGARLRHVRAPSVFRYNCDLTDADISGAYIQLGAIRLTGTVPAVFRRVLCWDPASQAATQRC